MIPPFHRSLLERMDFSDPFIILILKSNLTTKTRIWTWQRRQKNFDFGASKLKVRTTSANSVRTTREQRTNYARTTREQRTNNARTTSANSPANYATRPSAESPGIVRRACHDGGESLCKLAGGGSWVWTGAPPSAEVEGAGRNSARSSPLGCEISTLSLHLPVL